MLEQQTHKILLNRLQKERKMICMAGEYKQVIILRTDVGMKKGKMCAQASHASISSFLVAQRKDPSSIGNWLDFQKKVCLKVESEKELLDLYNSVKKELPCALIKDAGRTQVEPGTITALGIGPCPENKIDKYTKHLKLL